RGLDAIETDDMKDVKTVLVASEPLVEPRLPEEHYRALIEAFEADPRGVKDRLSAEKLDQIEGMKKRLADHVSGKDEERAPAPDPLAAMLGAGLAKLPADAKGANDVEQISAAMAKAIAKAPAAAGLSAKLAEAALQKPAAPAPVPGAIPLRPGAPPPAWAAKALDGASKRREEVKLRLAETKAPEGEARKPLDEQMKQLDARAKAFEESPFFRRIKD